ncbi:recombinase family protein [Streptomyces sp. NPDC058964]|uniref:recombinase family protein n=1 Tax=Streptomyces sp. NPDC058964 TaxID=3346681 RepID=UPI0036CD48A7
MSDLPGPPGHPELLVAEPLVRTEIKIGYTRVSTGGQKLERQLDARTTAGCRKIFSGEKSGRTGLRPELKACHAFLDAEGTLVVPPLDRYGRSLQDLVHMVAELRTREIGSNGPATCAGGGPDGATSTSSASTSRCGTPRKPASMSAPSCSSLPLVGLSRRGRLPHRFFCPGPPPLLVRLRVRPPG